MGTNSKWLFTKEQIANSPSRKYNIDADKEMIYRQQCASFIQDVGQSLRLPQLTINSAIVYMQRFFMFHSLTHFDKYKIGSAALFLASKVEDTRTKMEYIVHQSYKFLYKKDGPLISMSDRYSQLVAEMVYNENVLLSTLGFDFTVVHPHVKVIQCCELIKAGKDLRKTSYFMASNSLHLTTMCLQYEPTVVACFCVHLASKWTCYDIPLSKDDKPWFWYIDETITIELLEELTREFLHVFDRCPAKLKRIYSPPMDSHSPQRQMQVSSPRMIANQPTIPNWNSQMPQMSQKSQLFNGQRPIEKQNSIPTNGFDSMPLISTDDFIMRDQANFSPQVPQPLASSHMSSLQEYQKSQELINFQKQATFSPQVPQPLAFSHMPSLQQVQKSLINFQEQATFTPQVPQTLASSSHMSSLQQAQKSQELINSQQRAILSSQVPQPLASNHISSLQQYQKSQELINFQEQATFSPQVPQTLASSHMPSLQQAQKSQELVNSQQRAILSPQVSKPLALRQLPNLQQSRGPQEWNNCEKRATLSPQVLKPLALNLTTNLQPLTDSSHLHQNSLKRKVTDDQDCFQKRQCTSLGSVNPMTGIPILNSSVNDENLPEITNSFISDFSMIQKVSMCPPTNIFEDEFESEIFPKVDEYSKMEVNNCDSQRLNSLMRQEVSKVEEKNSIMQDFLNNAPATNKNTFEGLTNVYDYTQSTVDFSQIMLDPIQDINYEGCKENKSVHKNKKSKKEKKEKKEREKKEKKEKKKAEKREAKERKQHCDRGEKVEENAPLMSIKISIPKERIHFCTELTPESKPKSTPEEPVSNSESDSPLSIESFQDSLNFKITKDRETNEMTWMAQRWQTVSGGY